MGGLCSKQSPSTNPYAGKIKVQEKQYSRRQKLRKDADKVVTTPSTRDDIVEKEDEIVANETPKLSARYANVNNDDEFYDGIPRYQRSLYQKSRSLRVSEVSSLLGRAGSVGLERAVEVLDTLGSSMTNLNSPSGFISGPTNKNNELLILSFEVANTIVKGSTLMQSLSKRSIRVLKDSVLPAESIQRLMSKDIDQLLMIVASDKREELKVFSEEVIRFGNRCKDPQWHNLNRFFEKRSRDRTPQKQLRDTAESEMQQLMTFVQLTAELYQELHVLDKLQQNYRLKRLDELKHNAAQRGDRDNSLNILASELKSQRKLVKSLNKRSLWSKSMEEVMEKLVDIMLFLNQEINNTFGNPDETPEKGSLKLGPSGLALHYANIVIQIDTIVARSSSMTQTSRDTLYQSLPPHVKASFRSQLKSFHVEKELTVTEIKDEMEKTLHWLVSIATNTIKAHHGFGWVGEWANTGSDLNRRTVRPNDVMQIETLYHADKQKTEAYIIDLLLWLNYLISRSKAGAKGSGSVKPLHITLASSPIKEDDKQTDTTNASISSPSLIRADPVQELNDTREEKEVEKLDKTREDTSTGVGIVNEISLDVIDRVETNE